MKYGVNEILCYGEYLTDEKYNYGGNFVRVRTVQLDGEIYYISMKNGNVQKFQKLTED